MAKSVQTTQGRIIMAKPSPRIKLEGITELHEGDIIRDPARNTKELVTDVFQVPYITPLFKVRTLSSHNARSIRIIKDEVYRAEVRTESDGKEVTYLFEHTGPAYRSATAEEDALLKEALI